MNFNRSLPDFLFGTLVIGGAPLSAVGLLYLLGTMAERFLHFSLPERAMTPALLTLLAAALGALGWALWHRAHHRRLPYGFIYFEAVFGLVGAGAALSAYGFILQFLAL